MCRHNSILGQSECFSDANAPLVMIFGISGALCMTMSCMRSFLELSHAPRACIVSSTNARGFTQACTHSSHFHEWSLISLSRCQKLLSRPGTDGTRRESCSFPSKLRNGRFLLRFTTESFRSIRNGAHYPSRSMNIEIGRSHS